MGCEVNAREGSFRVKIHAEDCPRPSRVLYARDIATTFEDKDRLLDEAIACIGERLVRDRRELARMRLSIDEGIQNAFSHGNGGDPAKRICVEIFEDDATWGVIVRDEGHGFGTDVMADPRTPEGRRRAHGRGLTIMREFMHDVSYFNGGRTLRLLRHKTGRRSGTAV